jgi:hypothetical protein
MNDNQWVRFTFVFLGLQLFVMGVMLSHLSYKLGYEKGRMAVYDSFAEDGTEGTKYGR